MAKLGDIFEWYHSPGLKWPGSGDTLTFHGLAMIVNHLYLTDFDDHLVTFAIYRLPSIPNKLSPESIFSGHFMYRYNLWNKSVSVEDFSGLLPRSAKIWPLRSSSSRWQSVKQLLLKGSSKEFMF